MKKSRVFIALLMVVGIAAATSCEGWAPPGAYLHEVSFRFETPDGMPVTAGHSETITLANGCEIEAGHDTDGIYTRVVNGCGRQPEVSAVESLDLGGGSWTTVGLNANDPNSWGVAVHHSLEARVITLPQYRLSYSVHYTADDPTHPYYLI